MDVSEHPEYGLRVEWGRSKKRHQPPHGRKVFFKRCGHFCEQGYLKSCCGCPEGVLAPPCGICRMSVKDYSEVARSIQANRAGPQTTTVWNSVVAKGQEVMRKESLEAALERAKKEVQ